jgi:hypothetical protein
MRPSAAKNQYAAGYGSLSDAEITALMTERLRTVMGHVLAKMHPEATPIDGVDITYTLNVGIFTGAAITSVTHTMVYKLTGIGEFEFVSGPTPIQ